MNQSSLGTAVTLRQALLIMHAHLEMHWQLTGKPDEIGALLSQLSLWQTESGGKEPMDAAVFPDRLACADVVLIAQSSAVGYQGADILLNGKPADLKVRR